MSEPMYQIKQPRRRKSLKRGRKTVHNTRLPEWFVRIPIVDRFRKMTRRRKIVLLAWTGGSTLVLLALFTTLYFANTLGSKERIMNRNKTGVTLLDQSGQVFYRFYNARSTNYITLDNISEPVKQAVVASEDQDFYEHAGFSPRGILNAFWQNLRPGGLNNGGSTITQQLVKNALLNERRSYLRKYQELVLSIEIERRYSKDEILEMYLNSTYFGEGAFGIEDASQVYFAKPAANLNVAEASMLIGILPAPSAYSPISGDKASAKSRQKYVLNRMKEDGYISQAEVDLNYKAQLTYQNAKPDEEFSAPHFALMVKDQLEEEYGEEEIARSGFVVTTTLNLDWQNKAQDAVASQINRVAHQNVTNGSVVVVDPQNGQVRALVGSVDYNNEQFGKLNMADATRQPGSSFKPYVYATGIEDKKFSAATTILDAPTDFGGYKPENFDFRYRGDITVRNALATSLNIPAVKALQMSGIEETAQTVKDLGITTIEDASSYGLSFALGSAPAKLTEMTNAYATFANGGNYNDLTFVASIIDKNEKKIFEDEVDEKEVISPQTSYIINSILSDPVARRASFGSRMNLASGRLAAVKTGTTDNYRDALTVGYTPNLTIGVWVGNSDNSPMNGIGGSSGAGPIWKTLMNDFLSTTDEQEFDKPRGLTERLICRGNGALAQNNGSNTVLEYFIPGTLPNEQCNEAVEPPPSEPAPQPRPQTNNDAPADTDSDTPSGDGDSDGDEDEDGQDDEQPDEPTEPIDPEVPVLP